MKESYRPSFPLTSELTGMSIAPYARSGVLSMEGSGDNRPPGYGSDAELAYMHGAGRADLDHWRLQERLPYQEDFQFVAESHNDGFIRDQDLGPLYKPGKRNEGVLWSQGRTIRTPEVNHLPIHRDAVTNPSLRASLTQLNDYLSRHPFETLTEEQFVDAYHSWSAQSFRDAGLLIDSRDEGALQEIRGMFMREAEKRGFKGTIFMESLEEAEKRLKRDSRVPGGDTVENRARGGGGRRGGGEGLSENLRYMEFSNIEEVGQLIVETYGADMWGEHGKYPLLKKTGKFSMVPARNEDGSIMKVRIPVLDDKGKPVVRDGEQVFKEQVVYGPKEELQIDQGNFIRWIRERMMWFHGDSPDDIYNFQQVIGVENPYRRIMLQTMLQDAGRYFKSSSINELSRDDRTQLRDLIGFDPAVIAGLSKQERQDVYNKVGSDYVWNEAGTEIIGKREDITLGELAEHVKRETWLASTSRAKDITYRQAMGSDEQLPKTLMEIYKDNNFTKMVWSGKSLWFWMMTLPSEFHETVQGRVFDKVLYDFDRADEAGKRALLNDISVGTVDDATFELFKGAGRKGRGELLLDLARKEDNRTGAAVDQLFLAYYYLSDFDKLQEMFGRNAKLFQKNVWIRIRNGLASQFTEQPDSVIPTSVIDSMFNDDGSVNREEYIKFMNFFVEAQPDARRMALVREVLKDSVADKFSVFHRKDGEVKAWNDDVNRWERVDVDRHGNPLVNRLPRDATDEQKRVWSEQMDRRDAAMDTDNLEYADMLAFSKVRWTLAAAMNDVGARGYDAGTKIVDLDGYRAKQPSKERGGAAGNWYNIAIFKQTGRDLLTAIVTEAKAEDGSNLNPLEVFERIAKTGIIMDDDATDEEQQYQMAKAVEEAKHLIFTEQTMAQAAVNHYNRAYEIFHSLVGAKELRMEKFIQWDPVKGVTFNPDAFGEAVQEGFLKPLRYAYSTHNLDYGKTVRTRLTYNENNPYHKWQNYRAGMSEDDPSLVARTVYGTGPTRQVVMEVPLVFAMFGFEAFDNEKFWLEGHPGIIDMDLFRDRKMRPQIFKQLAISRIAADLYSHRDARSPFPRFDYFVVEGIIEALEKIPGDIYLNEYNLKDTAILDSFFDEKDIKLTRKMGDVTVGKLAGVDGGLALLQGAGQGLIQGGATFLKQLG